MAPYGLTRTLAHPPTLLYFELLSITARPVHALEVIMSFSSLSTLDVKAENVDSHQACICCSLLETEIGRELQFSTPWLIRRTSLGVSRG